jgi:heat shock protein HslJ
LPAFEKPNGVATATANPEQIMTITRLIAGRPVFARVALAAFLLMFGDAGSVWAAGNFPFDQELMLDAAPMRPVKRVPVLNVAANGEATINLWCRTVPGRVDLTDGTIKIEPGPLPEALPTMMVDGQCTPARMQADQDLLAQLTQVTEWRKQGGIVVLVGPKTLKFRPSSN